MLSEKRKEAPKPTKQFGKVDSAIMLNVRKKPDIKSDVLDVILKNADVEIDPTFINKEWYKVTTATGIKGYVMSQFIALKE